MFRPRLFIAIAVIVLVAILLYTGNSPVPVTNTRPPVDVLVRFFEKVVFGNELEPSKSSPTLARWKVPIIYRVDGKPNPQHLEILQRHIALVTRLTNLSIKPVSQSTATENMTILFLTGAQMSTMKFENVPPVVSNILSAQHTCYFLIERKQPAQISRSYIVVNIERKPEVIEHCLLEEFVQSLGLPNDSDMLRPSIFSDADELREMSRHDEIMLRTLYDNRLQDGLGREEIMKMAHDVIKDWDSRLANP